MKFAGKIPNWGEGGGVTHFFLEHLPNRDHTCRIQLRYVSLIMKGQSTLDSPGKILPDNCHSILIHYDHPHHCSDHLDHHPDHHAFHLSDH